MGHRIYVTTIMLIPCQTFYWWSTVSRDLFVRGEFKTNKTNEQRHFKAAQLINDTKHKISN